MTLTPRSLEILDTIRQRRTADAPTHGGHVLSYVYDSGLTELDELAAEAIRIMQPVNGLDPTTFPSVASMERDIIGFARQTLSGDSEVVGSVTSGGTESCLLAVKTARDLWRAAGGTGTPRLVAPITAHAAFAKASDYLGLELDRVSVDAGGQVDPDDIASRLGSDVALVVVSAPSYPYATLDPVSAVAATAQSAGIPCHVDACIGGWVLPWWGSDGDDPPAWDFRVPGVTSISADMHKFGYAPKGASVLLSRGRDRHRAQYFATTQWPGYPVVNPTVLGSRSAGALAAAWAIIERLGDEGFAALTATCRRATDAVTQAIDAIDGFRVVGSPVGPLCAVAADVRVPPDRRVDPHLWADRVRQHGWLLQQQPALVQPDGTRLVPTTHLTITPVTESVLPELLPVLTTAADDVRGQAPVNAETVLEQLPTDIRAALGSLTRPGTRIDAEHAFAALTALGIGTGDAALPDATAPLLALIEALPAPLVERLLIELLARLVEP